jgi:hypothetical protein
MAPRRTLKRQVKEEDVSEIVEDQTKKDVVKGDKVKSDVKSKAVKGCVKGNGKSNVKHDDIDDAINDDVNETIIDYIDDTQSEIDPLDNVDYNLTEKLISLDKTFYNGTYSATYILRPDDKTLFIPSSYIISQQDYTIKCSKNFEHLKQYFIEGIEHKCNVIIDSRLQSFISHLFLTINPNNIFIYDTFVHNVKTYIDYTSNIFNIQTNELNITRIKLLHFVTLFNHYYKNILIPINIQTCFSLIRSLTTIKTLVDVMKLDELPFEVLYQYMKTPEMLQNELQAQGTGEIDISRINSFTTSLEKIFNSQGIWKSPFKGLNNDHELMKLTSLEIYLGICALKNGKITYNILN